MVRLSRPAKTFTPKQGQYLAFIHLYTRLHRRPPAETDMQQYLSWTAELDIPVKILQDSNEGRIESRRKPMGVVGSITPWNFR
jgi:acyl-CoA reductase-like NAD-dependent aldehyde dehydrogenase